MFWVHEARGPCRRGREGRSERVREAKKGRRGEQWKGEAARRVSEKGNYLWLKTQNHNTFPSANQTVASSAHAIYGMCTHRLLTLPATRCAVRFTDQWGSKSVCV